jgi:ribosome-associated heat shock protein Hsp15
MALKSGGHNSPMNSMRIDKWLWAARFYKTRSLATDDINKGRVQVNGQVAKPSRDVKPQDTVVIRQGDMTRTVLVLGLSPMRGAAPVAQALYQETPESLSLRAKVTEQRRLAREPALSIEHGRPTKRDRRQIERNWNDRWSAGID